MRLPFTKWYRYRQNNSGGFYRKPAQDVWVEAVSAKHANWIAEKKGLYFQGEKAGDCLSCCGPRWDSQLYDNFGRKDGPVIERTRHPEECVGTICYALDGTIETHPETYRHHRLYREARNA